MSLFKDIVKLWNSDDLLSQSWTESYEMILLSNEIFIQAITYLREGENIKTIKALKKRDSEINRFQKDVRRKVVTHYAITQNTEDLPNGLGLLNMVVDIERIGDYCKNILDLAINHPTQIISEECSKLNSFLVYVSTDYVFDGKSGKYKEDDVTNPIGFYGKSKLDGEYAIQKFSSNWCIARTSTPFGYHSSKKSFPVWLIENLQNDKSVNILTDQITSPTYVPNLSSMLMEISQKKIEGIIHVSGATKISRFDFASLIVEKLNLDKNLLKPIKMDEINFKAQRPKDSSLDVSKATAILSEKPESVEQSLEKFIEKKNDNE